MIDRLNAMLEKYDELSNKLTSEEVLNNYELLKNISNTIPSSFAGLPELPDQFFAGSHQGCLRTLEQGI